MRNEFKKIEAQLSKLTEQDFINGRVLLRLVNPLCELIQLYKKMAALNKKHEDVIVAIVQDGWLNCGDEGMSDTQKVIHDAYIIINAYKIVEEVEK